LERYRRFEFMEVSMYLKENILELTSIIAIGKPDRLRIGKAIM